MKNIQWNSSECIEVVRLINKFFPESKGYIQKDTGISFYGMIQAMEVADFKTDYSCDPFSDTKESDLELIHKGGFEGGNNEIFKRLIKHTGFFPKGRVVVVPDALGKGQSVEDVTPFVCSVETLPVRLSERDSFFNELHDIVFVFESGETICIDHDLRVFWGMSRIRKLREKQFCK